MHWKTVKEMLLQITISKLALEEILKRLRKRPMHPNLKSLEKAKTRLTKIRLKIASRSKTKPLEMGELEKKTIKSMKDNKC